MPVTKEWGEGGEEGKEEDEKEEEEEGRGKKRRVIHIQPHGVNRQGQLV